LPKLFKAWRITHLVFEKDTDAYARERDEEIKKLAEEAGVEVIIKYGRTLYDPDELVKVNRGPTMTINQVQMVRSTYNLLSITAHAEALQRQERKLAPFPGLFQRPKHFRILEISPLGSTMSGQKTPQI
jgi:deoxyribodipyrimidine photolyase